jgi:hypothetical protein
MNARKPAPIGPLALVLRHVRSPSGSRHVAVLGVILGMALLVGIALLFVR